MSLGSQKVIFHEVHFILSNILLHTFWIKRALQNGAKDRNLDGSSLVIWAEYVCALSSFNIPSEMNLPCLVSTKPVE